MKGSRTKWTMASLFHVGSGVRLKLSSPSLWKLHVRFRGIALALALCFVIASFCFAQGHDVLCSEGSGSFQAEFSTGVTVAVGAARTGRLATRTCEATLGWDKTSLTVASNVSQLDVDTFGVDLGLGVPVAAFQVKKSGNECCMQYQVYSLEKPPRLLRTLTGGDFFSAADTDLDGRIEIWTDDAAAIEGFENLAPAEFDAASTIVLRFEHGQLVDVSSEFQPYFDREIAGLRKELGSDGLRDFKSSDGKLSPNSSLSAERLHRLRGVKAKILEIVWAYLYSGREQQAWSALAEMWPTADAARIHEAILNAHARGIRTQVDGVSHPRSGNRKKQAQVFDAIGESASGKPEVTAPAPIMLRRPLVGIPDKGFPQSELLWDLVIDSAGKVRSAEPAGKAIPVDADLMHAVTGWKFIPAFKDGRAVASRMRLAVSPRQ